MISRFFLVLLLLLAAPMVYAAEVTLRVGAHEDHDRVVMDWGKAVNYQLSGQAPDYVISFTDNAKVKIPSLKNLTRVTEITALNNSPLVLSVKLAPGNVLRLSRAGKRIIMDTSVDKTADKKDPAPQQTPPAAKADSPKDNQAVADLKNQIAKVDKWSGSQDSGGPSPATKKEEKAADKTPPPAPAPVGDVGPGGRPLTLAEIAARDTQKKAQEDQNKAAKPDDKKDDKKPDANTDNADAQPQFVPLPTQLAEPTAIAQIKLKVPAKVKFAAFMRGKKFWVVLDQPNTSSPTDEEENEPTKFGPVTRYQVGQGTGTAYRIQLQDNQFPAVTKMDDESLLFTVYQQLPLVMPVGLPIAAENSADQGPRLKIAGGGFATPLRVNDPDIGNSLFVIPGAANSGSVTTMHRWPQLLTVPAIHGVVIEPMVDSISVDSTKDGITIARPPKGLAISGIQGLVKNRDQGMGQQIFDLQHWRIGSFKNYRSLKAQLESSLADVRGAERLGRIMQIAQFEFAQGYGHEADGWLRLAASEFPDAVTVPEYLLLRGAVHVVMYDPFAADKDLAQPGYAYEPEVALWRGWAAAETEDYQRARYFFALASTLLHGYPDPYFIPIAEAAAETALLTGDVIAGHAMIDALKRHKKLSSDDKGEIAYLEGLEARLNDNYKATKSAWQRAIKSSNTMYAAKAQLLLVQEGLKNKDLEPKKAIEQLERLRFNWRGDRTELATLAALADLYIDAGQNRRAFECWQTILHYFPREALAEIARQNISKNFVTMFATDPEHSLQPVEALALYRDFINYAPTPEVREKITRQLIDRLIEVGMYHEATGIYATLVQPPQGSGDTVSPTANPKDVLRLAGIYLLDGQPTKAREILNLIQDSNVPYLEQTEHRLLLARANFQEGKFDDALAQLEPLSDSNSQRLRADIYWRKQDWTNAAKTLPMLMGKIPEDGKLSPEQARVILQQAVALSLANDTENLNALRDRYAGMMDATDQAVSFRLVTRPPKGSEVQSVQSIQSRIGEVNSFDEFLKDYEKSSQPKPAPAADTKADTKTEDAAKPPVEATKAEAPKTDTPPASGDAAAKK